jgi:hypothetical protein
MSIYYMANLQDFVNQNAVACGKLRREHLEMLAAAYLLKTDVPPDEVMLCEQMVYDDDGGMRMQYWFAKKE